MRNASARSSSTVRRGSFAISRRYALSVLASSSRRDTMDSLQQTCGGARTKRTTFFSFLSLDQIGWRGFHERGREPLLPVVDAARHLALDVLHELVDLALHLLDLPPHVEDDLDAGQIDAQ